MTWYTSFHHLYRIAVDVSRPRGGSHVIGVFQITLHNDHFPSILHSFTPYKPNFCPLAKVNMSHRQWPSLRAFEQNYAATRTQWRLRFVHTNHPATTDAIGILFCPSKHPSRKGIITHPTSFRHCAVHYSHFGIRSGPPGALNQW